MSKTALPFFVGDISALAKSLRARLLESEAAPGHVEMLNMLARVAGCRNFQHFRANALARQHVVESGPTLPEPVDFARVRALVRHFDDNGRLIRWPSKRSLQLLCLWALWADVAPRRPYNEREITTLLGQRHLFGDAALLRRELCDQGLLRRTQDCREYRRIEQRPPADARALVRLLRGAGALSPAAAGRSAASDVSARGVAS